MHSSEFSSVTLVVSIMVDMTFYFSFFYLIESSPDQTSIAANACYPPVPSGLYIGVTKLNIFSFSNVLLLAFMIGLLTMFWLWCT